MAELIDRKRIFFTYGLKGNIDYNDGFADGVLYTLDKIDEMPTIEAKPVIHAHWDEVSGGRTICTNCGNYPLYDYFGRLKLSDICPHCGAQMDKKENDNEDNL